MEEQRDSGINNAFYDTLKDAWYTASNHPVALLRAENRLRIPWISSEIEKKFPSSVDVLDIGCGAGFLTNALAEKHTVTGIDLSQTSLSIAEKHDATKSVKYLYADAYSLPFDNTSFDVVCAMDVLEHVESPAQLIKEAARVLKPNGLFFFHTFNRNPLSYLLIIKGVEWCVKNAPKNMHVYSLFITPLELKHLCKTSNLHVQSFLGFRPKFFSFSFFKMLFTRNVSNAFSFRFSKSLATGYCGIAEKGASPL